MRIKNQELMSEFYDRMLPIYPELTLEQMTEICYTQYQFLRNCIEGDDIVEIRLKYLGSFQVFPGRAKNYLYNMKERLRYRKIEPHVFQRVSGMINRYLNKIENNGNKTS